MMFRIAAAALFVLLCCSSLFALTAAEFVMFADSLLTAPAFSGVSWSVEIRSLAGDSVVYEKDADRALTPASVTKLFTSAAALTILGRDFRFVTVVSASAPIDANGWLNGDLIVTAGGDPTIEQKRVDSLGVPLLQVWADSLRASGLTHVGGDIVLHTWPYRFESAPPSWETGDVNAGFAPPLDGLGYNSNVCHLQVLPAAQTGDSARFVLDPPFAPVHLKPRVHTVPATAGGWLDVQVAPADTTVVISGEIPVNDDGEFLWVSVQDPARYFGLALKSALAGRGIEVTGDVRVVRTAPTPSTPRHELFVHSSAPLPAILALMNKESDNFVSEHVLRAIGLSKHGTADRRSGVTAILDFAEQCGIARRSIHFADGCGLSRQNLVTARAVVRLLRAMSASPASDAFRGTLAVSGKDGTLAYRLGGSPTAGRILAKTGTMTQVSNIAGYLIGERDTFVFAVLCNHFTSPVSAIRAAQDRLLERLAAVHTN